MSDKSIFSLIGERYLDTKLTIEAQQGINKELARRNVIGVKRGIYEYIAASSLWWNIVWWEDFSLNERDILIGWSQNAAIFGIIGLATTYAGNATIGTGAVIAAHFITLSIGLKIRSGTKFLPRFHT